MHIFHRTCSWRNILWISAVLLIVPILAHAQPIGGAGAAPLPVDPIYGTIANWVTTATGFLNMMIWIIFTYLTFLLDPQFIFDLRDNVGTEGALMEILNQIWQLSRDLMNVAFALALVGAAIYTVITADREFVSAHLRNFIVAVVLVNFSWFIPRLVLDVANVTAATIFAIPSAMPAEDRACRYTTSDAPSCLGYAAPGAAPAAPLPDGIEGPKPLGNNMFDCACKAVADFRPFPNPDVITNLSLPANAEKGWKCEWAFCLRYVALNSATVANHSAILNGLIINHGRLAQLGDVTRTNHPASNVTQLLPFVMKELLVLVIHIALVLPLLGLLIALVVRIPVLWLTMAFMPFYFLSLVIPDEFPLPFVKEYADKIKDWFLRAAFLPAAIAIPFSIGFIMANAGTRLKLDRMSIIQFQLIDGVDNYLQLLWVIMVLGILWTGTFMVLEAMMIDELPGKDVVQGLKSSGEEWGKFGAMLPLSTIQIPGQGNLLGALHNMGAGGARLKQQQLLAGEDWTKDASSTSKVSAAAKSMHADPNKADKKKLDPLVTAFNGQQTPSSASVDELVKFLKSQGISDATADNFDSHLIQLSEEMEKLKDPIVGLEDEAKRKLFRQKVNAMRAARPAAAAAPAPAPVAGAPGAPPVAGAPPAAAPGGVPPAGGAAAPVAPPGGAAPGP